MWGNARVVVVSLKHDRFTCHKLMPWIVYPCKRGAFSVAVNVVASVHFKVVRILICDSVCVYRENKLSCIHE